MATRAMAVAMMVATGGCAALGAHGRSATRPRGWIQDSEIHELAEHFARTVDCRRDTADPHAFMCPIAALRVEPFVPPTPGRALLGVSLVISANTEMNNIKRVDDLSTLYVGPRFGAVATLTESEAAGEEWNQTVEDALFERIMGRVQPFVLPPGAQRMLTIPVPEVGPPVEWDSQPERYFRVSTPNGLEVIVVVAPLAGPNMRVTLFPVIDALAESSKDPRELAKRQAAFDARNRASDADDAHPPLGMKQVGYLRNAVRRAGACDPKVRSTLAMREPAHSRRSASTGRRRRNAIRSTWACSSRSFPAHARGKSAASATRCCRSWKRDRTVSGRPPLGQTTRRRPRPSRRLRWGSPPT